MLNPGAALLLGSRHRLARDMQAYGEAAREDMRQLLVGDGLAGRMSLTFDIWTSENNVAFMGVTAHWVTNDFHLKQAVIDFGELKGSHTGDLIADELEEVLTEWGLEKMLFAVMCDNAKNNSKAMRLLAGVLDRTPGSRPRHPPLLSRWRHFRCVAQVVNLAVQAILKVDEVAEPLKRLRDVANFIGWSTLRTDRFFELQRGYATTRPQGPPAVVPQYNALIDLQEKAQLTLSISPQRSSLITAAMSKLERHMGGVSKEAALATFLDPRQKLAPFNHQARAAEGNSRGATLELGPDRVKALVRARLLEYQAASTTAQGNGGEVTSARGAGVHASAGGRAVDASAKVGSGRAFRSCHGPSAAVTCALSRGILAPRPLRSLRCRPALPRRDPASPLPRASTAAASTPLPSAPSRAATPRCRVPAPPPPRPRRCHRPRPPSPRPSSPHPRARTVAASSPPPPPPAFAFAPTPSPHPRASASAALSAAAARALPRRDPASPLPHASAAAAPTSRPPASSHAATPHRRVPAPPLPQPRRRRRPRPPSSWTPSPRLRAHAAAPSTPPPSAPSLSATSVVASPRPRRRNVDAAVARALPPRDLRRRIPAPAPSRPLCRCCPRSPLPRPCVATSPRLRRRGPDAAAARALPLTAADPPAVIIHGHPVTSPCTPPSSH
ncbi:unnamed protein product [Closterium sp. NIES-65]|nr:unnamed protein product [Closterium sp. NIES-65]